MAGTEVADTENAQKYLVMWTDEGGEIRRIYGSHGIELAEAERIADEKQRRYVRLGGVWEVRRRAGGAGV